MNKVQLLTTLFFSIISAVSYRMGGSGNFPRWVRPVVVSLSTILLMGIFIGFHWSMILCFGLSFGALTTYWKKKGSDAFWYNWLFTGLGYSLCILPFIFHTHVWLGFGIRTGVLTALTVLWSDLMGNAVIEEGGRGALITLTVPLLLIGT